MTNIVYLTTNQVITINTMQIKVFSPKEQTGVKEPNLLESALNRPKQTVFKHDAYPTIVKKAAALTESLAKKHPFHNANKRTALASLIIFLQLNGYEWTMDVMKEQDFIVDVVTNKYSFEEITEIIKNHSRKLK
ncbi:MAG TPA: type II toxin-antitoxin system death-on-curing family toxin [Pseudogracilibacillus sp.]|nr:type II toxin-antitoxin system death-on-curing family toxin [Pseudogracilibacillus sp.]